MSGFPGTEIEELFELGAEVIDREAEEASAKQAARKAMDDEEIERKAKMIAEACGVDVAVMMSGLGLRYRSNRYDYAFAFNYLGSVCGVDVVRPRGMGLTVPESVVFSDEYRMATARESLAKFVVKAQREYAADKAELVKTLRGMERLMRLSQYDGHRAWRDAEVQAAAVECLMRFVPGEVLEAGRLEYWLDNAKDFGNVVGLGELIVKMACKAEYLKKKSQLLRFIRNRENPRNGGSLDRVGDDENMYWEYLPLTRESINMLWSAASADGLADDAEVKEAILDLESNLGNWILARAREAQRKACEREAFKPFGYYEVRFALLGESDDGEEREIEVDSFYTLHDLMDADGYYTSVHGTARKPLHVVEVARVECRTVEQLLKLGWRGKVETEFGEIGVTPDGAELVDG